MVNLYYYLEKEKRVYHNSRWKNKLILNIRINNKYNNSKGRKSCPSTPCRGPHQRGKGIDSCESSARGGSGDISEWSI